MCKHTDSTTGYPAKRMKSDQSNRQSQMTNGQFRRPGQRSPFQGQHSQGRKPRVNRADHQNNNVEQPRHTGTAVQKPHSPPHPAALDRHINFSEHQHNHKQQQYHRGSKTPSPRTNKKQWQNGHLESPVGYVPRQVKSTSTTPSKGPLVATTHTNVAPIAATTTTPSKQSIAYAGAKFSDPPSPKVLPKPPVHWFSSDVENCFPTTAKECSRMTSDLKLMLNVNA